MGPVMKIHCLFEQPLFLFRSTHLKDTVNDIFTQVVTMLVEMGCLSLEEAYIDGTKMESRANHYTFVWRKTVEKNREKLEAKIRKVLEDIDEGIMQDHQPDDEPPMPIHSEELKKRIAAINRENRSKGEEKEIQTLENKYLPKLEDFVCPMGQPIEKVGEGEHTADCGFTSFVSYYEAKNCVGCPLKCICHNVKGNRRKNIFYSEKFQTCCITKKKLPRF
jgi:hypothetical protein